MRTLASTFSTREEAQAAGRQLEAIGIPHDRIVLKDVAEAEEGAATARSQAAGSTGQTFISVKVTTDQVERASEILKSQWRAEPAPVAPDVEGRPLGNVQDPGAGASARPLPPKEASVAPESPRDGAAAQLWAESRAAHDRARRSRYLIFFLLALVGAFMIGAWLGLAS